jgi:hypothetical protein
MESPFETIAVVVDKGIVPAGIDVVIAWSFDGAGGVSVSGTVIEKIRKHGPLGVYVACNPRQDLNLSKPDWNPPKLKKGWLTWDGNGGWWWWPVEPQHGEQYGWVDPSKGDGGDGEQIAEVMAEFFGCPCCDGFDERNCIWEVGE